MQRIYFRIYLVLCLLRLITVFLIFINPLMALVFQLALDILDGINASRGGVLKRQYHNIDKGLDIYWYLITLIYFILQQRFLQFQNLLIILFLWRVFGYLMFLWKGKKIWFAICPNFYEQVVILIIISEVLGPQFLREPGWRELLLGVLFTIKLLQEFLLHFFEFSPTEKILHLPMHWKE